MFSHEQIKAMLNRCIEEENEAKIIELKSENSTSSDDRLPNENSNKVEIDSPIESTEGNDYKNIPQATTYGEPPKGRKRSIEDESYERRDVKRLNTGPITSQIQNLSPNPLHSPSIHDFQHSGNMNGRDRPSNTTLSPSVNGDYISTNCSNGDPNNHDSMKIPLQSHLLSPSFIETNKSSSVLPNVPKSPQFSYNTVPSPSEAQAHYLRNSGQHTLNYYEHKSPHSTSDLSSNLHNESSYNQAAHRFSPNRQSNIVNSAEINEQHNSTNNSSPNQESVYSPRNPQLLDPSPEKDQNVSQTYINQSQQHSNQNSYSQYSQSVPTVWQQNVPSRMMSPGDRKVSVEVMQGDISSSTQYLNKSQNYLYQIPKSISTNSVQQPVSYQPHTVHISKPQTQSHQSYPNQPQNLYIKEHNSLNSSVYTNLNQPHIPLPSDNQPQQTSLNPYYHQQPSPLISHNQPQQIVLHPSSQSPPNYDNINELQPTFFVESQDFSPNYPDSVQLPYSKNLSDSSSYNQSKRPNSESDLKALPSSHSLDSNQSRHLNNNQHTRSEVHRN